MSAFDPADVPETNFTSYPEPHRAVNQNRYNRRLGDHAGLRNFGVNLTRIVPGGQSSYRHAHSRQDEFIFVLTGEVVLETNGGLQTLTAGMCAGPTMPFSSLSASPRGRRDCLPRCGYACEARAGRSLSIQHEGRRSAMMPPSRWGPRHSRGRAAHAAGRGTNPCTGDQSSLHRRRGAGAAARSRADEVIE